MVFALYIEYDMYMVYEVQVYDVDELYMVYEVSAQECTMYTSYTMYT